MSHSGANTTTPSTITRNDRIDLNEHESTTDDIPLISELFQQKANHEEIQHSVLTPEQLETKKKVTESYIRAFCIKDATHQQPTQEVYLHYSGLVPLQWRMNPAHFGRLMKPWILNGDFKKLKTKQFLLQTSANEDNRENQSSRSNKRQANSSDSEQEESDNDSEEEVEAAQPVNKRPRIALPCKMDTRNTKRLSGSGERAWSGVKLVVYCGRSTTQYSDAVRTFAKLLAKLQSPTEKKPPMREVSINEKAFKALYRSTKPIDHVKFTQDVVVDFSADETKFEVKFYLPGAMKGVKFWVETKNNKQPKLVITGRRDADPNQITKNMWTGSFRRAVDLPPGLDIQQHCMFMLL